MDLPLLFIGFLAGSPIIAIISLLYLKEYKLRQNADQRSSAIAKETQLKSVELLDAARAADVKILSENSVIAKQTEDYFKTKFGQTLNSSVQAVTDSQKELTAFLGQLKTISEQAQTQSQTSVEERVNQMFERLETRLSEFLMKTEQSTTSSIELELRSARQLIEGYKQQQIALIDENIVAMMEQTLSIVLAKKLSLKDQLDLIYEALEKAKAEKFLA